jgi:hypothetical protein
MRPINSKRLTRGTRAAHSIVATTLGEVAALVNAFVVQPGTPLILSSSPASGAQQANITLTVLGQATAWDATTTGRHVHSRD